MTNFTLFRSRRRTVAIHVRDGRMEVRAPLKMPKREIDAFVRSKEKWVTETLKKSNEQMVLRKSFSLDYGDFVTYLGKQYPIAAKEGRRLGFDGDRFYIPPHLSSEQIKDACIQIYRLLAKRDLTEKTRAYATKMSVHPAATKINGAKKRWGSCSTEKNLNFSWRLIIAEDKVVDYVVVHELSHLVEMNHSARFWAIVENVMPDYRERKAMLRELQHRLSGENWDG